MAQAPAEDDLKVSTAFVTFVCDNCDTPANEVDLYYCGICDANGKFKILCNVCGRAAHKRKDHSFNDDPRTLNGLSHGQDEIEQKKQV